MPRRDYDVRKIVNALREPKDDLRIASAHRGLRFGGTAENSRASILNAAEAGLECVELDVRITPDGKLVMIHDDGLGRTTDIAEVLGKEVYSPFTGIGFNPMVDETSWAGVMEKLRIKNEYGQITEETVPLLEDILQLISDHDIPMLLFLDFKTSLAIEPAYHIIKEFSSRGINAMEWCIWKWDSCWFPTPSSFETLAWGKEACERFGHILIIPVYDCAATWLLEDPIHSVQSYAASPHTISFEINLRGPGGNLEPIMEAFRSTHGHQPRTLTSVPRKTLCTPKQVGLGIFTAFGDFFDPEGNEVAFDLGKFTLPHSQDGKALLVFVDNRDPRTYDELLFPGDSPDDHDHRGDLDWLWSQGFTWVICEYADKLVEQWAKEGKRNLSHILA